MSEVLSVQWFPGHMTKTRRLMEKHLKLVDLVVEMADARIPASSRNPEVDAMIGQKPRILLLNKADSADDAATRSWLRWYKENGVVAISADCRSGKGLNALLPAIREVLVEKLNRWEDNGMGGRAIRLMIVGIPNVGKSSLINRLAGSKHAKVEDRPGVTRGKQWVTMDNGGGVELLDMPGVLWPKFEDKLAGERLAFTGAVKDDVLDIEHLAVRLLEVLQGRGYSPAIANRYKLEADKTADMDSIQLLEEIARKRGMLVAGGGVNTERASIMVVDEFRSGTLGRISLEKPDDKKD